MSVYYICVVILESLTIGEKKNVNDVGKSFLFFVPKDVAFNRTFYYRPRTKFAKIMCPQVFVCPQGGGHLCPRGSLSRGDICPGRGLCPGECLSREVGLCPRVSLSGGSLSGGSLSMTETPCTVKSEWYASYWNAFLLPPCVRSWYTSGTVPKFYSQRTTTKQQVSYVCVDSLH